LTIEAVSSIPSKPYDQKAAIARQARAVFGEQAALLLADLAAAVGTRFSTLFEQSTNAREAQDRRDMLLAFQQGQKKWIEGIERAWKSMAHGEAQSTSARMPALSLELIGNEVVESKILSSRLAMRILDKASWEFNDLQVRVRALDGKEELDKNDILRPESLALTLMEQWLAAGLKQEAWLSVQDVIQQSFGDQIVKAYKATNEYLIAQGGMKEIDLRSNVKRAPNAKNSGLGAGSASAALSDASSDSAALPHSKAAANNSDSAYAPTAYAGVHGRAAPTGAMSRAGNATSQIANHIAKLRAQAAQFASQQGLNKRAGQTAPHQFANEQVAGELTTRPGVTTRPDAVDPTKAAAPARPGRGAVANFRAQNDAEETRMQTASTPLARARMRAQGLMGQLKNLLVQKVPDYDNSRGVQMSPQLAAAMTYMPAATRTPGYQRTQQAGMPTAQATPMYAGVNANIVEGMQPAQVNMALREQTKELKKVANSDGEKATIEIVALMFQNILAEERIPTGVRVWFARLQMPVLRLALSEAEFFGTAQHPARRLIDRMGSCVLGFDANIGSAQMEAEVKRVVQTIEQYPETGRRVFQLVFDEFEKFLTRFLTEGKSTAKVVTLAQQVEQKETAAIQYTIELRKLLGNMPLKDTIREFLFKVWAEVLALAAIKNGGQHEQTLALKQVAADLLWAASTKSNRADRAKVIEDLPELLRRLREGMGMLGLSEESQDEHIKALSDTLAEVFMNKTLAMDQAQVAEVAQRIRHLEDYVSEDEPGDLPLDAESIELMLGIDMTGVEIISEGGSDPTQAVRAWALELERGSWFHLDHKGKMAKVQYAWRSKRGQLFLFADAAGMTYLFQLKRLAAYLQAGLMAPVEDETLTVRATRAALSKIDAQPERLLTVH
jgi:Protein of unknown function (DUF1631)